MNSSASQFPALEEWQETREALHAYTRVLGAIRRTYSPPHPKWWHASLLPYTSGLSTTNIPHPVKAEKTFSVSLELRNHYALFSNSEGFVEQVRICEGISANELFQALSEFMEQDGIEGEVDRSKFESDQHFEYSIDKAEKYFLALSRIAKVFNAVNTGFDGEKSPVQLWPHHFDLSFEVFGNQQAEYEEDGETKSSPSQIGIGFAPFDGQISEPYFYINPFPFKEEIIQKALVKGASWHTDSWKGAFLPYEAVLENGEDLLGEFLSSTLQIQLPSIR